MMEKEAKPLTEEEIRKKIRQSKTLEEFKDWREALKELYIIKDRAEEQINYILERERKSKYFLERIKEEEDNGCS